VHLLIQEKWIRVAPQLLVENNLADRYLVNETMEN
jgi:hypothetical protein